METVSTTDPGLARSQEANLHEFFCLAPMAALEQTIAEQYVKW